MATSVWYVVEISAHPAHSFMLTHFDSTLLVGTSI